VDCNYSNNSNGVYFGTEQRFTVTTRTHGSIFLDTDATGYTSVTTHHLADNVATVPDFTMEFFKTLGLSSDYSKVKP
jgi:hypothetical protein